MTPVYYNSFGSDRAGGPDEICTNSFVISVTGLDVNGEACPWDFLRVYSIERTTKDTVTNCRVVIDYKVKDLQTTDVISFTDTGLNMGYSFDWNALQFLGADDMTVGTIAIKDNTLFAGNITTRDQRPLEAIQEMLMANPFSFKDEVADPYTLSFDKNVYNYSPYSLGTPLQHWKKGETYRIGFQGQYGNGQWTPPIWMGEDITIQNSYEVAETIENNVMQWRIYYTRLVLDANKQGYTIDGITYATMQAYYNHVITLLKEIGIRRIRALRVELDYTSRKMITQGVLTGTVASFAGRKQNAPFACADWFLRGNRDFVFGNNGDTKSVFVSGSPDRYAYNWNDLQTIPFMSLGWKAHIGQRKYYMANTLFWFFMAARQNTDDLTGSGAINQLLCTYLVNDGLDSVSGLYAEAFSRTAPPLRDLVPDLLQAPYVQDIEKVQPAPFSSLQNVYTNYYANAEANNVERFSDDSIANQWFIDTNVCNLYSPEIVLEEFSRDTCNDAIEISFRGIAHLVNSSTQYKAVFTNGDNYISDRPDRIRDQHVQGIPTYMDNYWYMHQSEEANQTYALWRSKVVNNDNVNVDCLNQIYSRYAVSTFTTMVNNDFGTMSGLQINRPVYALPDDGMIALDTNNVDNGGHITYQPNPQEVLRDVKGYSWEVNFKSAPHLVFSLKTKLYTDGTTFDWYSATPCVPSVSLSNYWYSDHGVPANHAGTFRWQTSWYRGGLTGSESGQYYSLENLDATSVLLMDPNHSSYYTDASRQGSRILFLRDAWKDSSGIKHDTGVPYVWIVDLVRNITNQYGSDTSISSMQSLRWIPAGEPVSTEAGSPSVQFTRGDTYIQRFSFLKSYPRSVNNSEQWNRVTQGVSVWIESFINLDGRYDTHANDTVLAPYTPENWNRQNKAYTQADNFFEYPMVNYELLSNTRLADGFLWSRQKTLGEAIDSYTNLRLLNNFYQVDGQLGPINRLITVNNDLIGFQDKGIFNILFNSRVQVPASDGLPIELAQSYKVQGVRYLSTMLGTTNKWSVGQSAKGVYFIDALNKDICALGNPILNLSNQYGMKSWSAKTFKTLAPFDLDGHEDGFVTSVDTINDHVYFGNKDHSLCFNEQLGFFEGFYSYEGCPWRFNSGNDFLSVKGRMTENEVPVVDLYVDHVGRGGRFFGEYKPSSITYLLNPDPLVDKVWDTIEYRGHRFGVDGKQLPARTVDWVEVWNDYQHNSLSYASLLGCGPGLLPSMMHLGHHKFQAWNIPFPRQGGSLNRMRSPWAYLKLTFDNDETVERTEMHDMTILYTI
jgi:hypothetical protein